MTMRGCKRILTWSPSQYECELAEKSIRLAKKINAEGLPAFLDLPKQLSHGDFWDNNVLFYNDEIALIADFDFMGERRRIEDIALTLYFYAYFLTHTHVDAATPESLAAKLKAALDIYDSGLDMPLMAEERHCFPIALALQPLWGIGGWVVLLDDEEAARHHVSDMMWHINFGNQIMDNLLDWQYIFSG